MPLLLKYQSPKLPEDLVGTCVIHPELSYRCKAKERQFQNIPKLLNLPRRNFSLFQELVGGEVGQEPFLPQRL